jgi:hypothetical protein
LLENILYARKSQTQIHCENFSHFFIFYICTMKKKENDDDDDDDDAMRGEVKDEL